MSLMKKALDKAADVVLGEDHRAEKELDDEIKEEQQRGGGE